MTMKYESQIENPEKSTVGLASATQLIATTGSTPVSFNTSSASFRTILSLPFQVRRKTSQKQKEKHKTKREIFRENLRKAMRMNAEILKDLAEY